jgi:hypothetical protein
VALRTDIHFALHNINKLVFITEVESVHSAVQTDCLYKADIPITVLKSVYSAVRSDFYKANL